MQAKCLFESKTAISYATSALSVYVITSDPMILTCKLVPDVLR